MGTGCNAMENIGFFHFARFFANTEINLNNSLAHPPHREN